MVQQRTCSYACPPEQRGAEAHAAPHSTTLQYPFGGLPNFPEAYPILLSGNAQSNSTVGESVTGESGGDWRRLLPTEPLHFMQGALTGPALPGAPACSAGQQRRGVQLAAIGAAHV